MHIKNIFYIFAKDKTNKIMSTENVLTGNGGHVSMTNPLGSPKLAMLLGLMAAMGGLPQDDEQVKDEQEIEVFPEDFSDKKITLKFTVEDVRTKEKTPEAKITFTPTTSGFVVKGDTGIDEITTSSEKVLALIFTELNPFLSNLIAEEATPEK